MLRNFADQHKEWEKNLELLPVLLRAAKGVSASLPISDETLHHETGSGVSRSPGGLEPVLVEVGGREA
jgi:hypothetical protein